MKINYITNVPLAERSGGWTAANAALYEGLSRHHEVHYVGPINPSSDMIAKIPSKLARIAGFKGTFHFFSSRRLDRIASQVSAESPGRSDVALFFGVTPWIHVKTETPYFAYTDCAFATYIKTYHETSRFRRSDLDRIMHVESTWAKGAKRIFVSTQWAAHELSSAYKCPGDNVSIAGIGGGMPPPARDTYSQGMDLVFIGYDFVRKGGEICFDALRVIEREFPDIRLKIIGGQPPREILRHPRVEYMGILRKTIPEQFAEYKNVLSQAFALLHPTSADIGPLTVIEAGYHGCPTVASASFGLPELIEDRRTGFLVKPPLRAEEFAVAILHLLRNQDAYRRLRERCREYCTNRFSWERIVRRILTEVEAVSPEGR